MRERWREDWEMEGGWGEGSFVFCEKVDRKDPEIFG